MSLGIERIILPVAHEYTRRLEGEGMAEFQAMLWQLVQQERLGSTLLLIQKDVYRPTFCPRVLDGLPTKNGYQLSVAEHRQEYHHDAARLLVRMMKKHVRDGTKPECVVLLSRYDQEAFEEILKNVCFWEHFQGTLSVLCYRYDTQFPGDRLRAVLLHIEAGLP